MSLTFRMIATGAMLTVLPVVWQAGHRLRSTTLTTAWRWSLGAVVLWIAVWSTTALSGVVSDPLASQFWYVLSVVLLCPAIAVLGARRPGSRVWNWFVLVPLIVVLGRPLATSWNRDFEIVALHVETPVLLGHLLVLVMGGGNFLGTRHTLATLLFVSAQLMFLIPFFGSGNSPLVEYRDALRIAGTLLLSASIWTAARADRITSRLEGFDQVWRDFRDSFGIVWARPIQDRMNETARKEQWPVQLQMDGFHWSEPDVNSPERIAANPRIEHTLRWLLRRFVDPDWIDVRLGSPRNESIG